MTSPAATAPRRYSPAVLARLQDLRGGGRWPEGMPGVRSGQAGSQERGLWICFQILGPPGEAPEAVRFQAFGCPVAIACASWLAEWATRRSPAQIRELRPEGLSRALDLVPEDAAAAVLALDALRATLAAAASR